MPEPARWRSPQVLFLLGGAVVLLSVVGLTYCPAAARAAPDFNLAVVSSDGSGTGDRLRLGDQRGKVVLLDFWATWCGPCQASTPALVRLYHRFRARGFLVVGVNVDESGAEQVPGFMRHFGIDYPVLYDTGGTLEAYRVQGLPTTVLIDRAGRIRRVHEGLASEALLEQQIEGLL